MNWEVYPEGVYKMLKKFAAYPNIPELIITENGAAFPDELSIEGSVKDVQRQRYLQDYMGQILRAKREGVRVGGHFVWTFTDNFEWAEGYRPRFGLVYIDFKTQRRIVKDSGYWYRNFLRGCANGRTELVVDSIGPVKSIINARGLDKRTAA
jgi:beta-glucosidase